MDIKVSLNRETVKKVQQYIDYMNDSREANEREWTLEDAANVLFYRGLSDTIRAISKD